MNLMSYVNVLFADQTPPQVSSGYGDAASMTERKPDGARKNLSEPFHDPIEGATK